MVWGGLGIGADAVRGPGPLSEGARREGSAPLKIYSSQVGRWGHTPDQRVAASALRQYHFGLRLAIAQAVARPVTRPPAQKIVDHCFACVLTALMVPLAMNVLALSFSRFWLPGAKSVNGLYRLDFEFSYQKSYKKCY